MDVFFGTASFADGRSIRVRRAGHDSGDSNDPDERVLRFKKAVIATGSRPAVPGVPGLIEAGFLTTDTLFDLTEQPRELAIIGAGAVGCEMAQAFARLGTTVTLIESGAQVLPREDPDAAALVLARLRADGVQVALGAHLNSARREGGRAVLVHDGGTTSADSVLIAAGRVPVTDGLNLEAAGVARGPDGIVVDDHLRTSNRRVYAAGDACSSVMFTHLADEMARVVVQNALFFGRRRISRLIVPWCTFTSPEVAHVGLYEEEAKKKGIEVETYTYKLEEVDRAILDGKDEGFARVHIQKGSDKVLGATIVAAHAGDMIGEFSVLMKAGAGAKTLASTIHPYPTQAEVNKKAVNLWRKAHFTPRTKDLLTKLFAWMRR